MKRSASVTLTLAVALSTAYAQQGDPCEAATFNGKVCLATIRGGSYCSQGSRVSMSYPQAYPYYYDRYRDYISQGGAVSPLAAGRCPRRSAAHGFGTTAVVHGAGSRAGS